MTQENGDAQHDAHPTDPSIELPTLLDFGGMLMVTSGRDAGCVLPVPPGASLNIGRSPDCSLVLADMCVSRFHLRVVRSIDDLLVTDLGSKNGTYVNGQKITSTVALREGDRVQLSATTTLRFSVADDQEREHLSLLYEASVRDALTGLHNRRHLDAVLKAEVAMARRKGIPFSVILMDIDRFKEINDSLGHPAGDEALRAVARILMDEVRGEDVVARPGGDEFVVVARSTTVAVASAMAARIRVRIADVGFCWKGRRCALSASFGVACLDEIAGIDSAESLMQAVDEQLYRGKRERLGVRGGREPRSRAELGGGEEWREETSPNTVAAHVHNASR